MYIFLCIYMFVYVCACVRDICVCISVSEATGWLFLCLHARLAFVSLHGGMSMFLLHSHLCQHSCSVSENMFVVLPIWESFCSINNLLFCFLFVNVNWRQKPLRFVRFNSFHTFQRTETVMCPVRVQFPLPP